MGCRVGLIEIVKCGSVLKEMRKGAKRLSIWGRAFQAEDPSRTKVLPCDLDWRVGGTAGTTWSHG